MRNDFEDEDLEDDELIDHYPSIDAWSVNDPVDLEDDELIDESYLDRDIDRHPLDPGYDPNFDPDFYDGDERDLTDDVDYDNDELYDDDYDEIYVNQSEYDRGFKDGVHSEEAKNYWFEKFEYKQPTKF